MTMDWHIALCDDGFKKHRSDETCRQTCFCGGFTTAEEIYEPIMAAADALAEACNRNGTCIDCGRLLSGAHSAFCQIDEALAAYRALRHGAQAQEG